MSDAGLAVAFPLTVKFEDGSTETYSDRQTLEQNLEDYDSGIDTACEVRDALGRRVFLQLKLLRLVTLRLW
jgi:hypothetical protein